MHLLSTLRIGTRLAAAFAAILLLTVGMTAVGLWRLQSTANAGRQIASYANQERIASEWLRGTALNATRTLAVVKATDPSTKTYFQEEMARQSKAISKLQQQLESTLISEEGKALLTDVARKRKEYIAVRNEIMRAQGEQGDPDRARQQVESKMVPALDAYVQSVEAVVKYEQLKSAQASATIDDIEQSSFWWLVLGGAVAVVLGAAMAWSMARSITRPLHFAVRIARAVAAGDLSLRIDVQSQDETGEMLAALKEMSASLRRIVGQVRQGTETIAAASQQIATGNQDLSTRTEQQAGSLEETASSMEELTSTVKHNADHAQQAGTLAETAAAVAAKGGDVIGQVVTTMEQIDESARHITQIIAVIDGIAFQTNILALNAAVEAARAGEQGRGFAVVASEVRALAQRSAAAAKEIKGLIDTSVERVATGGRLVTEAGTTMREILESVRRVHDIMTEIVDATQEQSAGLDQINAAVTQMDEVTQQNAALVEEAAAAAVAMQDQATRLSQEVSVFKIDGPSQAPARQL